MIQWILFECIWALLIAWSVVQFAFGLWAYAKKSLGSRWAVSISLIALPLLLVVSRVVVTPRERIIAVCRGLAQAADDGDIPSIAGRLARDFESADLNRDEFLRRTEQSLTRYGIDDAQVSDFQIEFTGDREAAATFLGSARLRTPDAYLDRIQLRWRLKFADSDGVWLVREIDLAPTPPFNVRDIRSLLGR